MDKQITNVLNELSDKFGLAIDWSSENVLPYLNDLANRYIRYEIISSVISIVVMLLCTIALTIFGLKFIPYANKKRKADEKSASLWEFFVIAVSVVVAFGSFVLIICIAYEVSHLLQCYTIPEKVIFEYIQSQI